MKPEMRDLNHNIERQHGFESLRVEGVVPEALRGGTLYRVGPRLVRRFGHDVHPFLADGLITAVEINETPSGTCALVQSEKFLEEEQAGRPIYSTEAGFVRRLITG